jgi:predicted ABC-type ATPase
LAVISKRLFIIGGCNGAGKTTASFNILPDILQCKEYVNADEIARGLSPFQPEKVAFEAGRIMLHRIDELLQNGEDFAFETTLATESFRNLIIEAKAKGYFVHIIFFWLNSVELAEYRVAQRVKKGGHNIPNDIIKRRYFRGIKNFFKIYQPISDLTLI